MALYAGLVACVRPKSGYSLSRSDIFHIASVIMAGRSDNDYAYGALSL